MATADFVISLYRIILGREPENDDIVQRYVQSGHDESTLLRAFFASPEFQERRAEWQPARLKYPAHLPVQDSATPQQLEDMWAGIAREWQKFGETEPYWSVLTNDIYRTASIATSRDGFYATGRNDIEPALAAVRRAGLDPALFRTAIDFGCGVGRLTLSLSKHVEFVTGVDVSQHHLRHATQRALETSVNNVAFKCIASIAELSAMPPVDFVVSIIVLQHNPPPIMADLFARLLRLLNAGGVAYIQLPTYIVGYAFDIDSYLKSDKVAMEMNYLPQKKVFEIIRDERCQVLEIREDGHTGNSRIISQTFVVQKS